jgi:hypothetical protein
MPLSWDFSAHKLASFGGVDQRQPEQRRNSSPASGLGKGDLGAARPGLLDVADTIVIQRQDAHAVR